MSLYYRGVAAADKTEASARLHAEIAIAPASSTQCAALLGASHAT